MPRTRGQRQSFTFNKGWNTEASPLTFPENTATDLDNVVLDVDGSIRRRMGVSCESAGTTRYLQGAANTWEYIAIGFFKWTNVAGSGDFNLLVSQKGTTLQFNGEDGTDYGSVDFTSRVISARASQGPNEVLETTSGLGYFFCCGPSIDPFYLEYDLSTDTVSLTGFEIQIRDFDGVDDGLAVDNRPTTLSAAHEYNLRNQGWPEDFPCITDAAAKSSDDTVGFTFNQIGSYPSNADVIYYGKTSTGADETELDRYNPTVMVKNVFGTTPAPKGKYIFNAFNIDRDSIVAGATSEVVNNRPRAVGFHNGRVFFAGVNAVGYTGKVYYSQQLTNIDKIGKCYQDNDPTSEIFNDLLATDGGEIDIPNCGNILRIEEGPAGIVVFASNGMWEITGQEGKFSATEFFVRKVTDIGCVGGDTVVNADGTFYYWSDAGIVGTTRDQVSGNLSADIITQTSIQLGYLLFGGPQRRGARGVWIRGEKKVVWLYSTDTTYDNVSDRFHYNGVLVLDTILGAFYKYSISDFNVGAAPYVSGIVESASSVSATVQETVTAGGTDVTAGGVDVTIPSSGSATDTITSTWKLQVVRPRFAGTTSTYGIDFATFSSRTFTDWYFENNAGVDYTSFLETGFDYGGQAMFDKKPTYVYTYMSRISKSNTDGGYYNIPDPTGAGTTACDVRAGLSEEGYEEYEFSYFTLSNDGAVVNPDGTYALTTRNFNMGVQVHEFGTAKDFSTTTGIATVYASPTDSGGALGMGVDPNGVYIYTYDPFRKGHIYQCTTAWDFSTIASYKDTASKLFIPNDDGTVIYGLSYTTTTVDVYSPTTPFDASAASLGGVDSTIDFSSFLTATSLYVKQMQWWGDGTEMHIFEGDATRTMHILSCSTPYDLSTWTLTASIPFGNVIGSPIDASVRGGGFIPWDSSRTSTYRFDTLTTPDGLYGWVLNDIDCDGCGTIAVVSETDTYTEGVNNLESIRIDETGTKILTVYTGAPDSGAPSSYTMSTPYDLTTISAQALNATTMYVDGVQVSDMWVDSTGTNLFTIHPGASEVAHWTLGIAWDASSTLTLESQGDHGQLNWDFVVVEGDAGNAFWIWADFGSTFRRYTMSGFDASTLTFDKSTTLTSGLKSAQYNSDGSEIYFSDSTNGRITTYELSTAYDLSTATLSLDKSKPSVSGIRALAVTTDNSTNAYVLTGDTAASSVIREHKPTC